MRIFLQNVKMHRVNVSTVQRFDFALARELEFKCYGMKQNVARGKNLVHGVGQVFPELKPFLTLSRRALIGWERVNIPGEGGPFWLGTLLCVVERMLLKGQVWEALIVLFAFDTYARESDWESLYVNTVHVEIWNELDRTILVPDPDPRRAPRVAVTFGSSALGLSAKTGANHTLEVDDPWLRRVLWMLVRSLNGAARLFPIDQAHFRVAFNAAQEELEPEDARGPAHSLRHSRPSAQIADGELDLEGVRRRGFWKQMKSVQRYAEQGALAEHMAKLPEEVRSRGERLLADRLHMVKSAVTKGPGWRTHLGKILRVAAEAEPAFPTVVQTRAAGGGSRKRSGARAALRPPASE